MLVLRSIPETLEAQKNHYESEFSNFKKKYEKNVEEAKKHWDQKEVRGLKENRMYL